MCLGLAGVFLAGAATGVFAAAAYVHHRLRALHSEGPGGLHELGVEWLDWKLDLTEPQERELEAILTEVHVELFHFKSDHTAEIEAIVRPGLRRIDALLSPEQAEAWHPIRARIAAHAAAKAHGD